MELIEPIETINTSLIDLYGIDTVTGLPMWRVVWSEDQFEKRYGNFTDYSHSGIFIRNVTEVRIVPKYRQWVQQKYVLERLTVVPEINREELAGEKSSYEPIYIFEDNKGNYLPPRIDACKFAIDLIYAATGKKSMHHYVDEYTKENTEKRIENLVAELFGNETETTDALAYREGVVVPSNYKES